MSICRSEWCNRVEIHPAHEVPGPKQIKPTISQSPKPPWSRPDAKGLTGAVARATSKSYPTHLSAILRNVHDDYGSCNVRTVYRHLKKLVERGHIIKLDVGLSLAAYIRPKSKLLNDLDSIRDHMLSTMDWHQGRRGGLEAS